MSEFQRKIEFTRPAFHERHPDPSKDRGVGSVRMRVLLIGPEGAITFDIFTGWHLKATWDEWEERLPRLKARDMAMGGAVFIHSRKPLDSSYEAQGCDVLDGKCYSDMSFVAGETLFEILVEQGEDALFAEMQKWYDNHLLEENDHD